MNFPIETFSSKGLVLRLTVPFAAAGHTSTRNTCKTCAALRPISGQATQTSFRLVDEPFSHSRVALPTCSEASSGNALVPTACLP